MDMWVPHKELKKIRNQLKKKEGQKQKRAEKLFFSFFFLILGFSHIQGKPFVRIRRDKHGKCSTRQGLGVSTRNTKFHREFR